MCNLSPYSLLFLSKVYLGNYPDERFTENNIQDYITKTSAKMSGIAEKIKTRNADLDVPYPYMCPTSITNSITI